MISSLISVNPNNEHQLFLIKYEPATERDSSLTTNYLIINNIYNV